MFIDHNLKYNAYDFDINKYNEDCAIFNKTITGITNEIRFY